MIYLVALVFLAMFVQSFERLLTHLHLGIKKGWLFLTIASFTAFITTMAIILTSLGVK